MVTYSGRSSNAGLLACLVLLCQPAWSASTQRFVRAVQDSQLEDVREYLASNPSPDALKEGLSAAIRTGNRSVFELILERVSPSQYDVALAAYNHRPEFARQLHAKGAVFTNLEIFVSVAQARSEEVALLLLEFGEGLTGQLRVSGLEPVRVEGDQTVLRHYDNEHGMTALGAAAQRGFRKLAQALLDRGADPNVLVTYEQGGVQGMMLNTSNLVPGGTITVDGAGSAVVPPLRAPALILAIRQRDIAMVSLLLASRADSTVRDNRGDDACAWARRVEFGDASALVCR